MDGDLFGDALVDDLLNFTRESSGDFDTSDLMDILEPDHLENNILLDDGGSLDHMPDVAALDELDTLTMATAPPTEDDANAESAASAEPAPVAPSFDAVLDEMSSDTDEEQDEEDYDPLEALTSSMLPEDDLEALARLAAGEDIEASPQTTAAARHQTDEILDSDTMNLQSDDDLAASLGATDLETASLDDLGFGDTDLSSPFADNTPTVNTSSRGVFEDTFNEHFQPNAQELEELAMLASGLAESSGEDLSSLVSLPEEDEESAEDTARATTNPSQNTETARNTTAPTQQPKKQSKQQPKQKSERQDSQSSAARADTPPQGSFQLASEDNSYEQAQGRPQGIRHFSQFASTWQSQTALATPEASSEQARLAAEPALSQAPYQPPNQLHRHFNASFMLEAADRLKDVLDIPDIPIVVFLGRAAERCLGRLDGHDVVSVAQLTGRAFVPNFQVPPQESFRRVLMAKRQADEHKLTAEQAVDPNGDTSERPLLVADISELELDGLNIALKGSHLLLTRLQLDPAHQHLRGTLTLVGDIDIQAGALFLKAVKNALESPITLMV